jgi:ankyrin repeat protein
MSMHGFNYTNPQRRLIAIVTLFMFLCVAPVQAGWFEDCANGRLEAVSQALQSGQDANQTNETGLSCLMLAAYLGQPDVVRRLVKESVDLEKNNDLSLLQLDPKVEKVAEYAIDELIFKEIPILGGIAKTMLGIGSQDEKYNALLLAIDRGYFDTVEILLKANANPNTVTSKTKTSALMLAAAKGNQPMVKLLLEYRAQVQQKNIFGKTALHFATLGHNTEIALQLIKAGLAVDSIDSGGITSLMGAAYMGDLKMVNFLIYQNANINASTKQGYTALMFATMGRKLDSVKLLIRSGADLKWISRDGFTAYKIAEKLRYAELVEYFQKIQGSDL